MTQLEFNIAGDIARISAAVSILQSIITPDEHRDMQMRLVIKHLREMSDELHREANARRP